MSIPVITFIQPGAADPTRCGECGGLPSDAPRRPEYCVWSVYDTQAECRIRGPECLAAEKLCADLREAGQTQRNCCAQSKDEDKEWYDALAAIDAAAKERG